jgi:hypothetical protein
MSIFPTPMRIVTFLALLLTAVSPAMSTPPKTTYTLRSQRRPGQTDHVVINIKAGGETKFVDQGKPQHEKLSVLCDLEYDEKMREVAAKPDDAWRSVRKYTKATVVNVVGGEEFRPTLRADHRLICAEAGGQTMILFSPAGPLYRTELDLIEVQADSLLLDRLLPEKPAAVGDTWQHSEQLMAAMLGLDESSKTDVQSRLREVIDKVARFDIYGRVEGAIHGAPTQIEVKGKYRFDRHSKRIDWLALVIKENRQSSLVGDGLDVESVLQLTVRPLGEADELSDAALEKLAANLKSSPDSTRLTYNSAGGHWQFEHDRRWHVFRDQPEVAVLRMLDRGEVIAQCNVSSLPLRAADKLVDLNEFQDDVRHALNKSFGEFVEASQKVDDAKHRVLRVVAEGKASDIPIQWTYYHVADQQGRQVAFTFTVEKSLLERFADADKSLVQSLRFVEPATKNE